LFCTILAYPATTRSSHSTKTLSCFRWKVRPRAQMGRSQQRSPKDSSIEARTSEGLPRGAIRPPQVHKALSASTICKMTSPTLSSTCTWTLLSRRRPLLQACIPLSFLSPQSCSAFSSSFRARYHLPSPRSELSRLESRRSSCVTSKGPVPHAQTRKGAQDVRVLSHSLIPQRQNKTSKSSYGCKLQL